MKTLKIIGLVLLGIILLIAIVPFLIPIPPLEDTKPVAELADPDSLFVDLDGLTVHYKKMGAGEPIYILLHGFGASTYSWREVMPTLSQAGTVIAYDRPAFGLTDRPMPGEWQGPSPYSYAYQTDMVIRLMDALGIEKAILVGNSAGGTVAAAAALKYPQRVTGLVLVDAAIYTDNSSSPLLGWLLKTPQANRLGPLFTRNIRTWGLDFLKTAWHDPSRITPEIYENYQKPLQVNNWDKALWELTRDSGREDITGKLDQFQMPVLVITGDDDRIVPTAQSLELAAAIPGSQLAVIPACGHVPQEECPQVFMQALQKFVNESIIQ